MHDVSTSKGLKTQTKKNNNILLTLLSVQFCKISEGLGFKLSYLKDTEFMLSLVCVLFNLFCVYFHYIK